MTITPVSLGSGSNKSRFAQGGAAKFVNCYTENQGNDAKSPTIILASDGLASFATMPTAGIRASIEVNGYLYVVAGTTFYRVDSTGVNVVLGGVPTSGLVTMVRNRRTAPHIGIVSGLLYYVYDTADGSYTHVTGPAGFAPTSIAILDGYGILPSANATWYTTDVDDLKTIDPLHFAQAESNPDDIVRAAAREGEVVLFGTRSTEWWSDTGGVDFAFTRAQAIELGCLPNGGGSVCNVDRTIAWAAHDGTVRLMQGYDGKRISNHDVERSIAAVDPSELRSTTWWNNGHTFYVLSSESWTKAYDLVTGQWHDRSSAGSNRWRISCVTRMWQTMIAGDAVTGDLYTMSADAYDEAGSELVMTVQTPPVHAFPYRLRFNAAFVDFVPGVGLATGASQDVVPQAMLAWSDNGGQTWSGEQRADLGRLGDMVKRVVFRRLGVTSTHGRTFRISVSAAVAKGLLGMSVDAEKLGV